MSTRPLTKNEAKRLLAAAGNTRTAERDSLLVLLCMTSGLRIGECCSMKVSDCFDSRGRVRKQFSLDAKRTKSNKAREVYLHPEAVRALHEYMPVKKFKSPSAPLLEGQRGRKNIHSNSGQVIVKQLMEDAGIENNSSHALRKTCATMLRRSGADLALIQSVLGHSSLATTQRYLGVQGFEVAGAINSLKF